jgi:hypothetical protein
MLTRADRLCGGARSASRAGPGTKFATSQPRAFESYAAIAGSIGGAVGSVAGR